MGAVARCGCAPEGFRRWVSDVPTAGGGNRREHGDDQPLFRISIAMFFDDHGPPHFHRREESATVRIDTLKVIVSTLGRRQLRFVLAWADLHKAN
jgi:hypothetical protein